MTLFDGMNLRDIRSTTTFRLAFLLSLLFTLGTVGLCRFAYVQVAGELINRSEQTVRREAARFLTIPTQNLPDQIRMEVDRNANGLDYFALLSPNGRRILGNITRPAGLEINQSKDVDARDGHGPMRILAVQATDGSIILIARDISERRYILGLLSRAMLVSSLMIAPIVLLIGAVLSLRALSWVGDLRRVSQQIEAGYLAVRMPLSFRHDELDIFAATVNGMIEALGRVVAQIKSVTDAIAHDLRTPLTHVKTNLDEVLTFDDVPDRARDMVEDTVAEMNLVLDRFSALLRIAELEASERRSGFGPVRLDILVGNLCELYRPLAEDCGILLLQQTKEAILVHADRSLLFEALSNLLDNAIKFAHHTVVVSAERVADTAMVRVRDDGPGVPADERHAVLQRFYRRVSDKDKPGTGLGLSVVVAILHLHHFQFELGDANPGLVVTVIMPAQAQAQ